MSDDEALEGHGGASRGVEAVHEGLDAGAGGAPGALAAEHGGDAPLGGRRRRVVRGGALDRDARG